MSGALPAGVLERPFVCESCGHRTGRAGYCTTCLGPYLDLRDDEVRFFLEAEDRRRRERRYRHAVFLGIAVSLATLGTAALLSKWVLIALIAIPPQGVGMVFGFAALAMIVAAIIVTFFPAEQRFPYLRR